MSKDKDSAKQLRASQAFLREYGFVRMVAFSIAPNRGILDDIIQDSFVYFVENADRWDFDKDLKPLLRKIISHMGHRHWREYTKTLPDNLRLLAERLSKRSDQGSDHFHDNEMEDRLDLLRSCLKKLSPKNMELVEKHYNRKTTLVDLAKKLNMNLSTLRNLMFRIRALLRDCMEKGIAAREDRYE